ncbi:MAG: type II toxin-antitoxin system VapC family toxin [Infirmifilum sp.]
MSEQIVYLDTSVIVKRYVAESGSDYMKNIYKSAYNVKLKIAFSLWNVGETLGVLDKAKRLGRLNEEDYGLVKRRFLGETTRLLKLNVLIIVDLKSFIIKQTWKIMEKSDLLPALKGESSLRSQGLHPFTGATRL